MKKSAYLFTICLVFLLIFMSLSVTLAQEPIAINENRLGEISPENPQPVFLITVVAGQEVFIEVLSLASGLAPEVSIFDAGGTELQVITGTSSTRVSGTVTFPTDGIYSLQVRSRNQGQGQFVLSITGEVIETGPPALTGDTPASGQLAGNTSEAYSLSVNTTALLNISGPGVTLEILDENGQVVAVLTTFSSSMILGLPQGNYSVVVKNDTPDPVNFEITTSLLPVPEEVAPVATEEAEPVQTEEVVTPQEAEAPQQQSPALTYTPTITQTSTAQSEQNTPATATSTSTVTYTSTFTPTLTATATYTPTQPSPPQTAPADANFNSPLNIPLDSTASVTDFVSYPQGDVEDRIRFDVTGMNPNASLSGGRARLTLAVSCFGTGTQHIQFFTGGQSYSCGQTIIDREITYDSRTGSATITAIGGESTYVQWVITGTATRIE